jgi:hypothetical protein
MHGVLHLEGASHASTSAASAKVIAGNPVLSCDIMWTDPIGKLPHKFMASDLSRLQVFV